MSPLTRELDMEGQQRSELHQLLSLDGIYWKVAGTCLQSGQLNPLVAYILTSEVQETKVTAILCLPSQENNVKARGDELTATAPPGHAEPSPSDKPDLQLIPFLQERGQ